MSGPSLTTRQAWFDRGAEAFRRSCPTVFRDLLPPEIEPVYVCPLCVTTTQFRGFFRRAVETRELTAEHAPPKHAGGGAIALTCAPCNHTAGTLLDAHAHRAERLAQQTVIPVRVNLRGNRLNMSLTADESGVKLIGEPKRNAPAVAQAFFAELTRIAQTCDLNWKFDLEFHRSAVDLRRADLSRLRAAYIVAFAKFGYRFVLQKAYSPVREIIREPTSNAIEVFKITRPGADSSARHLIVLREPEALRGGVAVQMGRHVVFLPGPNDVDFYDRLANEKRRHGSRSATFRGREFDWPKEPEHHFDFTAPSRSS